MVNAIPIPAPECPLCGRPNDCAPARSGTFDVECWCTRVSIPTELLECIEHGVRGRACVCEACATAAAVTVRRDQG